MTEESHYVGLNLPRRDYRFIDRHIRRSYGGFGLSELAVRRDPLTAFMALSDGLFMNFTRRGYSELVYADKDLNPYPGAVEREMDGDQVYEGSIERVSSSLVRVMMDRFFETKQDMAITATKNPGPLGRKLGRSPIIEVVELIPYPENQEM